MLNNFDSVQFLQVQLDLNQICTMNNANNAVHVSTQMPLLSKSHEPYYIYISILDPINIGGVGVPLLRKVWVENSCTEGKQVFETVDKPMYLPISSSSINNIEVQIRNDSGELVNFPLNSSSSITLHFRQYE